VQVSISTPDLSGVPVDLAFDDLRSLSGLPNSTTSYSAGTGAKANGKQLIRNNPVSLTITNNNEPRYMFVAVPNPTSGTGVVDVIRIDQSFRRVDTNAFRPGNQSIPATDVQVVADYFRQ